MAYEFSVLFSSRGKLNRAITEPLVLEGLLDAQRPTSILILPDSKRSEDLEMAVPLIHDMIGGSASPVEVYVPDGGGFWKIVHGTGQIIKDLSSLPSLVSQKANLLVFSYDCIEQELNPRDAMYLRDLIQQEKNSMHELILRE